MKNFREAKGRRSAGGRVDFETMRVEYDSVDRVFRLYRDGAIYCATIVRYTGDVASFEVVGNTLRVFGYDGISAFFDAAGQPVERTAESSGRTILPRSASA